MDKSYESLTLCVPYAYDEWNPSYSVDAFGNKRETYNTPLENIDGLIKSYPVFNMIDAFCDITITHQLFNQNFVLEHRYCEHIRTDVSENFYLVCVLNIIDDTAYNLFKIKNPLLYSLLCSMIPVDPTGHLNATYHEVRCDGDFTFIKNNTIRVVL